MDLEHFKGQNRAFGKQTLAAAHFLCFERTEIRPRHATNGVGEIIGFN